MHFCSVRLESSPKYLVAPASAVHSACSFPLLISQLHAFALHARSGSGSRNSNRWFDLPNMFALKFAMSY